MLVAVILMIICSTAEMADVRLVGSDSHCSGTPEIFQNGQWLSVSSKTFDLRAAMVLCRELDCGNAVSVTVRRGVKKTLRTDFTCEGLEASVKECQSSVPSPSPMSSPVVVCSDSVRLVDGAGLCSGRVEVKFNQSWATVCDADVDWEDADVVCRELGCGPALTLQGVPFGVGDHPFVTEEFQCKGTENRLLNCSTSASGAHNCMYSFPLMLTCSELNNVRLVDGSSRCDGTIEVFHSGQWRRVSAEPWSLKLSAVVCRQLRCGFAVGATTIARAADQQWQFLSNCKGSESALRDCKHVKEYQTNVIEIVICSEAVEEPSIFFSTPPIASINLYRHQLLWSNNFTITCSTKPQFPGGVFHLKVPWTINSYTQKAVNYSTTFFFPEAEYVHKGSYSCVYENQVGIKMTKGDRISVQNFTSESEELYLTMTEKDVRLVDGRSRCDGTIEVFHSGQWRRVSAEPWSLKLSAVVCRQLHCGSAVGATTIASAADQQWQFLSNCTGSESALRDCKHVREYQTNVIERVICSGVLVKPSISSFTSENIGYTDFQERQQHVEESGNFTITCSTEPQFPGGMFHLKVPWTNSNYTQKAVNHSATFFFPEEFHEGTYSCIYENQVGFDMKKDGRISVHNFISESWPLYYPMLIPVGDPINSEITAVKSPYRVRSREMFIG